MEERVNIESIKSAINENIGKFVLLKSNKGRKKIVTNKGIIDHAYPNVFTVKFSNQFDIERTESFSYSDVLTSRVEITLC